MCIRRTYNLKYVNYCLKVINLLHRIVYSLSINRSHFTEVLVFRWFIFLEQQDGDDKSDNKPVSTKRIKIIQQTIINKIVSTSWTSLAQNEEFEKIEYSQNESGDDDAAEQIETVSDYDWDGYDSDKDPPYVYTENDSDSDEKSLRNKQAQTKILGSLSVNKRSEEVKHSETENIKEQVQKDKEIYGEAVVQEETYDKQDKIDNLETLDENNTILNTAKPVIDSQVPHVMKRYARKLRRERTLKRHTGQEYVTANGKIQRQRAMKDLEDCRLHCKEWLSEELRNSIFKEYWDLGSQEKRKCFIAKCITSAQVETRRKKKKTVQKKEI